MEDDGDDKDDSKRRTRNLSEKKRRDQFNTLVNELGMMVSSNNRKMDKSTVLKATISFLKNHNDITVRSRAHDVRGDWKPSFFPNDEFTYLVLEALEGFLMVISPSGRVHYVSESIASLLGHNPADILDQSIFELVREDDRSRLYAVLSMDTSMATKGHELSFQVHLRRGALDFRQEISYELVQFYGNFRINTEQSDGSDRSSCFQEHDSRVLFACAGCLQAPLLIRDVSLVDSNRCEFTSRHSLEWKFLFLDHRGPPIIGYLPFEVLGTSGYDYYHFDDLEKVVACHEALMEKGELTSCYYRFLTKGQQWIWLQTRFYITYHQWNSKPEFVVCAHRVVSYADVSNSVKSEGDQGDMRPKGGGHRQNAPSEGSRLVVHPPSEGSLVGGGPLSDSTRLGSALSEGSRLVVHAPSEGTRLGSGLSEGSRIVVDAVSEGSMRLVSAPTEGSGRVVNAPSEGSRLFVGVPSESVTTAALSPSCISKVSDAFANYRPRSQCASGTSVSVISAAGTVATVATVATATTGTSWGARGRYESRQGSDTDFERLQGSDTGFERRQESDTGFERRQGSDTGFERRQGSDTGFERRQGSDTGFERRQGSDTGFERRPGSDTGLERRQGSDTGLERRQGSDNGESRRNNEQERQNSYKESVTPLTPQHVMGAQYLEPSPFGSGPPTAVSALALLQPRPHCVDEHLHRKHDELQQMIVRQQAELQQVKEQLLLARLGILPPLVSVSVPLAQVQSPYVTMDDMQQPVPLMQAQIMYEPQPPITEYPGQYPPHPHQQ